MYNKILPHCHSSFYSGLKLVYLHSEQEFMFVCLFVCLTVKIYLIFYKVIFLNKCVIFFRIIAQVTSVNVDLCVNFLTTVAQLTAGRVNLTEILAAVC